MTERGPLCAGIDPHASMLAAWGLPDNPAGLEAFAMRCVEGFAGVAACVKPQSAFFERHGAAGVAVLERTLTALRQADTLSILDVKRGDIGSTMAGYAEAYLAEHSPLRADAITVSPFLGYGSLRPALDLAEATGRGVFVLTLTSNPEGAEVQHAHTAPAGRGGGAPGTVAGHIVAGVGVDNARAAARGQLGSVGMVVGATVADAVERLRLDLAAANAPLLAPGVGAQGGTADDLRRVFGAALPNVLAASSREVLGAGPDPRALRRRTRETADALTEMVT